MIAQRPEYNWEHKSILGEENAGLELLYQQVTSLLMISWCVIYD